MTRDVAIATLAGGPDHEAQAVPQGPRAPRRPDSAVILSGSIGRGHDSVAEACRVALGSASVPSSVLDCMSLLGGAGSRIGTEIFRRLISVPAVYDGFHFSHLRNGTWLPRALERAALRQLLPGVRERVADANGRPLVVSVFPTGVSAAGALKHERPDMTTVAVCTDACVHRMWVAEGTDLYLVCSPLAEATIHRYTPGAPVAVVPPPVRAPFYDAPKKAVAREALGVPDDARCVLLMAGGWGLGPLAETAEALASAGYWVLAVAGSNENLHARLRAVARRSSRVVAFGLTDRVPELMAAADAVVTSSGQTCNEARVVGRWLVILDIVPGHGRENTMHELEQGGALACSSDPVSVRAAVDAIFRDQPDLPTWPIRDAEEWAATFFSALGAAGLELARPGRHTRRTLVHAQDGRRLPSHAGVRAGQPLVAEAVGSR